MAKTVNESRKMAEQHRTLAGLYDRRAAQEELAANLERYGEQLGDVRDALARIDKQIAELAPAREKKGGQ